MYIPFFLITRIYFPDILGQSCSAKAVGSQFPCARATTFLQFKRKEGFVVWFKLYSLTRTRRRVLISLLVIYWINFTYSAHCAIQRNSHFCFLLHALLSILSSIFLCFFAQLQRVFARVLLGFFPRLCFYSSYDWMLLCLCINGACPDIILLRFCIFFLVRSFVRNHCPHWRSTSVDPNALEERRPEHDSPGLTTRSQDEQAARDEVRRTHESSHNSSYCRRCIRWIMSRQSLNTRLMFSVSTAHVKCG